jgi:CHAT domain-containing protein
VQDRNTAKLMTLFYQAMWRDHLAPAAALREAQRSLRREPRYRNPYSWAGFVLQGDWLGKVPETTGETLGGLATVQGLN